MRIDNAEKKQKHKRRHKKLYEKLSEVYEVPAEAVSSVPIFKLCGHHEIEITGCDGILEYSGTSVILTVGKDKFYIRGDNLVLSDFKENVLFVRGNIKSAAFDNSYAKSEAENA